MSRKRIEKKVTARDLSEKGCTDFLGEVYGILKQAPRVVVLALEGGQRLAAGAARVLRVAQAEAALQGVLVVVRTTSPRTDEILRSAGLRGIYGVGR